MDEKIAPFHVIPVYGVNSGKCTCGNTECSSPGKHPRTAKGCYSASNDRDVIRHWAKQFKGCNWGIATGHDGLVVIDIDPRHDGHLSWCDLIEDQGYTSTLMARTGSGGTHIYYKVPEGKALLPCSSSRVGKGIDVRGSGGYIVAPPSTHVCGKPYTWCEPKEDIADIPQWLYDLAKTQRRNKDYRPSLNSIIDRVDTLCDGVGKGMRNEKAASVSGYYLKKYGESEAWARVYSWNQKNDPPLTDQELRNVFNSIRRYH